MNSSKSWKFFTKPSFYRSLSKQGKNVWEKKFKN